MSDDPNDPFPNLWSEELPSDPQSIRNAIDDANVGIRQLRQQLVEIERNRRRWQWYFSRLQQKILGVAGMILVFGGAAGAAVWVESEDYSKFWSIVTVVGVCVWLSSMVNSNMPKPPED